MENETLSVSAGRKRGRPVGADSEQTRRTVLAAARDIIAERGYQATTFQQIAQRAGVSRPTLHYYFATREDLYDALLADVCERLGRCAAAAAGQDSLRGQLAAFMAEMNRLAVAEPAMMKLVVTARIDHHGARIGTGEGRGAATDIVSTVHDFYDAVVLAAAARGELPAGHDPHAVADMLAAVFWGLGFHARMLTADIGVDGVPEVARQLLSVLDSGLLDGALRAPADA
ncbi:TetR/AcrR family transcriptional regulator [Mycolicibacterium gilvum]|uniref:TetR family transcriptional regulator n=1 Tax=Mycolicibacterium gilvum TaxID=1804 RepID=A0A378SKT6_9MYCO|nr:TetR/AcrR family transcriptional regulator [Mycolicibacterium gilvum]MCV7057362.1 TetR/AcrR family transcriptional regulator [Mycolicibacterium gilvum]STZ43459.1 TetR family transcriptional regulator [Mycolicibacterium gilvum]